MTSRCWGFADFANGMGAPEGFCVWTDPAGDQISANFVHETHAADVKSARGSVKFTAGSGKFAGISGGFTYVNDYGAFRTAIEGTFASHATLQGSYKLP